MNMHNMIVLTTRFCLDQVDESSAPSDFSCKNSTTEIWCSGVRIVALRIGRHRKALVEDKNVKLGLPPVI